MFKESREDSNFDWKDLGNIEDGRPNLGGLVPVSVYRLMQFTLRDILIKKYSPETADIIFYEAGFSAGTQFCRNVLDKKDSLNDFAANLQKKMKELNIGILKIEKMDTKTMDMVFSVEEDLDCSGLPMHDETVCDYDEGFIAGIFKEYTGVNFSCKEVDCWASGARTCRFDIHKI